MFSQHLNAMVARWLRLLKAVGAPYRPERHYMRGPGPKWHAVRQGALKPTRIDRLLDDV